MRQKGKIFGIGLPKTGTSSLAIALRILGYKAFHNPKLHRSLSLEGVYKYLGNWDAITNFGEHFYPQLDANYPGSKFILTVRDAEQWLASWTKQVEGNLPLDNSSHVGIKSQLLYSKFGIKTILRKFGLAEKEALRLQTRIQVFGTFKISPERCRFVYDLHKKNAVEYFTERPEDLLIMDISKGDGWEQLCPFLGISEVPTVPFPHGKPVPSSPI